MSCMPSLNSIVQCHLMLLANRLPLHLVLLHMSFPKHSLPVDQTVTQHVTTILICMQGPQIFVVRSGTGQAYLRNPPSDAQSKVLQKTILLKTGSEALSPCMHWLPALIRSAL